MGDIVLAEGSNELNITLMPIAEALGSVIGTVKDEITREYLEGVRVAVNSYGGYTDSSGYYEILDIPLGEYRITFSKAGYHTGGFNLSVVGTMRISYVLYPE